MEQFGAWMAAARVARHLTQQTLAHHLGISPTYLSDMERGRRDPCDPIRVMLWARLVGRDEQETLLRAAWADEKVGHYLLYLKDAPRLPADGAGDRGAIAEKGERGVTMRYDDQYWRTGKGDGTAERPIVLWKDSEEGLIILDDGGKWYTNQTGGIACHHPAARGVFVPMAVPNELANRLENWMFGISPEDADAVDAILAKFSLGPTVDRSRLGESEEAWLYVIMSNGNPAILTWENSD